MNKTHLTETKFSDLPLQEPILRGLDANGYTHCTPIQELTLPVSLTNKDIAGQAQTGTGKTLAFLLATFNRLMQIDSAAEKVERNKKQVRSPVILAPTRELAIQIHKDAVPLAKSTGLRLGLVYGGEGYETQRQQFEKGVDILIGTTGRLIDYFKQGCFTLDAVSKWWCWMKPIACSIWALSKTSIICSAKCRRRTSVCMHVVLCHFVLPGQRIGV